MRDSQQRVRGEDATACIWLAAAASQTAFDANADWAQIEIVICWDCCW